MTASELHEFLQNPEIFRENVLPAHSDHFFYESEKDVVQKENMPLKQSLNGVWKFAYAKNLFERPENFYEDGVDVSKWANINVPGHIELQGYGIPHYANVDYPWDGVEELYPPMISKDDAPVGCYVTEVKLNKNLKDKPVFISFQGVETAFRLFVNGRYVGFSEDSFTPSDFEITDYIRSGKNRIAVEVYKRSSASWLEDQDMWRFFGIFREVYLYATPKLHVKDMFVKATLDKNYERGVLDINAELTGEPASASAELYINDWKTFEIPLEVKNGRALCHVEGLPVKFWSAEEPNLYECRILLKDKEGKVGEIAVTNIGFRTFEIKDKLMLLNGKRILFKGADRHEFSAVNGRNVSKEEMLWDIKTFKRNNINAVRTSHYPNQSMWYRLCDEYGIYMISETNLETHGTWQNDYHTKGDHIVPGSKPEWKAAVLDRANNMFMTDKNHPAVLIWSLGNEAHGGDNFIAMHDLLREKDDTRVVHYEGTIHNMDSYACTDIHSKMYDKPADIERYLQNNPEKPFISCEYMHAMGNSLGGMKLYTDLEDKYEMYQGGFIWDFLDQALWQEHNGKKRLAYGGDFGDKPTEYCFCTDGLVFADRTESPKCSEAKNLYANVHLTVSKEGFSVQNRNLFIDLSRYYFIYKITENGKTVFEKTIDDLAVAPGATENVIIKGGPDFYEGSDYVVRLSMHEKFDTKWAAASFIVAFTEETYFAKNNPVLWPLNKKEFKHVAYGSGNDGAWTDDFSVMFAKSFKRIGGGMVSLKDHGKDFVSVPPTPTYFRAYTDNDKGFNLAGKANFWHMLSRYQAATLTSFEEKEGYVEAMYEYAHPETEKVYSTVLYKVYPEGNVEVTIKYLGGENLPILPLFGYEFKIDKEYENVEYFGKGPVENYRDRDNGVFTDIFRTNVKDNLTPYLVPQEVGNRTGVRYAKFTNKEGHGILFAAKEGTFELGFLPNSAYEMLEAGHLDELPPVNYTWIRIMAGQMGIGGDDSWGAPVHEEFRLDQSKELELTFEMRFI